MWLLSSFQQIIKYSRPRSIANRVEYGNCNKMYPYTLKLILIPVCSITYYYVKYMKLRDENGKTSYCILSLTLKSNDVNPKIIINVEGRMSLEHLNSYLR